MKISIAIGYVNRKRLFYETLKSIAKTKYGDFEVIAVDDCSISEERIEDFLSEFSFLKVIRLEPENKWYINTCIPYNIGIRAARGDIIILQNAECLHVHDIITYLSERVNDLNYISVSTYALNPEITNQLSSLVNRDDFITYFKSLPQQFSAGSPTLGWYNHSKYRPTYYHFCSAITKKNLDLLGGFDERYAYGTSYEDNELIERIKKLGLNMIIADEVSVIHQWHVTFQYQHPNFVKNHERNKWIFENITQTETKFSVNE